MQRVDGHLDRVGEILLGVTDARCIADHEEARSALATAKDVLVAARRTDVDRTSNLALAHSRLFVTGAWLASKISSDEEAAPSTKSVVEALVEACRELLAAEEAPFTPAPRKPGESPDAGHHTLELCAELTAGIDTRPTETGAILKPHDLDEAQFAQLSRHYRDAIHNELQSGRSALQARFDAAYMQELERARGELGIDDYADIKVASSRGTLDATLAALHVPRRAVMVIERLWVARMVDSVALRQRVRAAIEERRSA